MLRVFKDDDLGYLQWAGENQSGYILNTRKIPDPDYMILHRARCSTITRYPKMDINPGGFTERGYIKICADRASQISSWIKLNGRADGTVSKRCSFCKP